MSSLSYSLYPAMVAGCLSSSIVAAGQITIDLKPAIQLAKRQVTLGDIARLETSDLRDLQALMSLPLGAAPADGTSVHLRREDIAHWLRMKLGRMASAAEWRGADQVEIQMRTAPRDASGVRELARASLQAWLSERSERFILTEAKEAASSIDLPAGEATFQVRPLSEGAAPARQMQVWVDVYVDARFTRSLPVAFEVSAFRSAWVARQPLAAGSIVQPALLERSQVDITQLAGALWEETVDGPSLRLRHAVAGGEALLQSALQAVPTITRGETVKLRLQSGLVTLESDAKALQDGWLGQVMRVKAPTTRGSMLARVAGPRQVEVVSQ